MSHFETVRRRKDGSLVEVSLNISPILDSAGKIVGASKTARDITERRQTEKEKLAMFNEVKDLKAALDEHAIVAITNHQGKITFVNDKFCAISQYSREELLGQDHRIINSGHHPQEFMRQLWTTITRGQPWHGEIKNRAKDGSNYWVDTTIVPFLDEQGKPRQYVAIRADITNRKQAEEALRVREEQFSLFIEHSPAALAMFDREMHYVAASRRWLADYGITDQKVVGLSHYEVFPEIPARWREIHRRCLAGAVEKCDDEPFVRADGKVNWIHWEVRPWHLPNGQIGGIIIFSEDISDRKRDAEAIRQLNNELEHRVVERTAQLESANKELEAFSYSVSHDLRAPLRAVDGFSQAVEEDYGAQLPEEGRRYLRTIRDGAQRMGLLIDDLLSFSRLSRQPVNNQKVDTGKLVRAVLAELNSLQLRRQVVIQIGDLPACDGDPALLKQVWINLLSNAFKYTRKCAAATIEIGCTREKGEAVYFVRDNGSGFDMQYVHKLFGVFQRLHHVEDYEGTGVGLAIVQRIVHRHGGRIWAEAAVNRGATFHFTLNAVVPS